MTYNKVFFVILILSFLLMVYLYATDDTLLNCIYFITIGR